MKTRAVNWLAIAALWLPLACSSNNNNGNDGSVGGLDGGTSSDARIGSDVPSTADGGVGPDARSADVAIAPDGGIGEEVRGGDATVDAGNVADAVSVDGPALDGGAGPIDARADALTIDGGALLTTSQMATILTSANSGEIVAAETAVAKAQAKSVKSFAQTMIHDHTASQGKVQDLVKAEGLSPAPSALSAKLDADAGALLGQLHAEPSASFDRAYVQAQITAHRQVLDLLDGTLIPEATDAKLRSLLQATRTTVSDHLNQAEKLLATL